MLDNPIAETSIRELLDQNPMVGSPKVGTRRAWTNKEMAVLRARFPAGGVAACLPLLPGRSATSIYQQANRAELRAPRSHRRRERNSWTSSPQIDAIIVRIYQSMPSKGDIKRLAITIGRPGWWVRNRALKLGLAQPRFREAPWTEPELEFVAANAHKDAAALSSMLRRRGFRRTPAAILVKLKRSGVPTGRNADLEHYTGRQLARLFGVDQKTVSAWIAKGWLKAGHRGTARTPEQGGDEYWIHRREVRKFIIENIAVIDIRKVEKCWFVDVLAQQ